MRSDGMIISFYTCSILICVLSVSHGWHAALRPAQIALKPCLARLHASHERML